MSGVEFL